MRRAIALAVLAALGLGFAPAASAAGDGSCPGSIGPPELGQPGFVVQIGSGSGDTQADGETIYIDVRSIADDKFVFNIWIYRETNGRDGLQRGPNSVISDLFPGIPPTPGACDEFPQDTALF